MVLLAEATPTISHVARLLDGNLSSNATTHDENSVGRSCAYWQMHKAVRNRRWLKVGLED